MVRTAQRANGRSDRDRFGLVSRWQVATSILLAIGATLFFSLSVLEIASDPQRFGPVESRPFEPIPVLATAIAPDVLALTISGPLLVGGLWAAMRDSVRGYVLWLGALGFLTYLMGVSVFDGPVFALLALFSVALFTTVDGVLTIPIDGFQSVVDRTPPTRLVAVGFALTGLLLALVWVVELRTPQSEVLALYGVAAVAWEFGVLVPAAAATAWLLVRGSGWSHALASVLAVVLATVSLVNLADQVLLMRGRSFFHPVQTALYALVAVLALALVATYLRHLGGPRRNGQ